MWALRILSKSLQEMMMTMSKSQGCVLCRSTQQCQWMLPKWTISPGTWWPATSFLTTWASCVKKVCTNLLNSLPFLLAVAMYTCYIPNWTNFSADLMPKNFTTFPRADVYISSRPGQMLFEYFFAYIKTNEPRIWLFPKWVFHRTILLWLRSSVGDDWDTKTAVVLILCKNTRALFFEIRLLSSVYRRSNTVPRSYNWVRNLYVVSLYTQLYVFHSRSVSLMMNTRQSTLPICF